MRPGRAPVIRPRVLLLGLAVLVTGGCQEMRLTEPPGSAAHVPEAAVQPIGFTLASVGAGSTSACGVGPGGIGYCWGLNLSGELGNGTIGDTAIVPAPVSGGLTFSTISEGANVLGAFACGLTTAGQAYCWGSGSYGHLGNGCLGCSSSVPVPVEGGLTFTSLSVNGVACGLVKGGQAYCWGYDGEGELGNGSSTPGVDFPYPVAVSGGLTFTDVKTGYYHACGLAKGGRVYCWGANHSGQLGQGYVSSTGSGSNVPIPVSTALTFVALSAGAYYTCALTKDGTAYCWGDNADGELGDGSTILSSAPRPVSGGASFTSIAAGLVSTCGIAKGGQAYCWGSDYNGELGNDSASYAPITSPVAVAGGFTFTSLSVGGDHTALAPFPGFACGTTAKLGAFCWGFNGEGELGIGSSSASFSAVAPAPIAMP